MLTSRAKYATRALLELSLCYGKGAQNIQEIAKRQNIPVKFLEQILASLRMLGFIESRRGPGGGYTLRRPPTEISLGEVVRAIEGPLAPISCVSVTQYQPCGCPDADNCGLRQVFKIARDALAQVLDNTSYQDIIDRGHAARALIADEP
jgi:Rrf2 family protein